MIEGDFTAFNGIKFLTNPQLTVPGEPIKVKRTWSERLFELPWHPLIAIKIIPTTKPDPQLYEFKDFGVTVCHPETLQELVSRLRVRETA